MTWPSVDAPATAPSDHGEVRTQAYYAGGGDYFRSGYYSHGLFTSAASTNTAMALSRLYYRPFVIPVRRAFDRIGVNVTTAAAVGGVLRFGLYGDAGGYPGAQIVDAGTISSETTGGKEATISQAPDPGVIWVAIVAQVVTCSVTFYAAANVTPFSAISTAPPTSVSGRLAFYENSVTGALPATATVSGATTDTCPVVLLRAT